jgi:MFS-type transporter involved in bile tolerance (Atg22 family)
VGPLVVNAIIDATHNNWMGFPFLFALCASATIVLCFVNVEKGREDCRKYVEQRRLGEHAEGGISTGGKE